MQRRFFIFSSLTTFLSSLTFNKIKNFFFRNKNFELENRTNFKTPFTVLSPGQKFLLPETPQDGMFLGFELKIESQNDTAYVISNKNNLIYGSDTILQVDTQQRFYMIYFSDSNLWMPTLEDPGLFKNSKNTFKQS